MTNVILPHSCGGMLKRKNVEDHLVRFLATCSKCKQKLALVKVDGEWKIGGTLET